MDNRVLPVVSWAVAVDRITGNPSAGARHPQVMARDGDNPWVIHPMQALEPEADTAARKARVAEALLQYKQQAGLVVDPQAEAAAKLAYGRGEELMQRVRSCPCG